MFGTLQMFLLSASFINYLVSGFLVWLDWFTMLAISGWFAYLAPIDMQGSQFPQKEDALPNKVPCLNKTSYAKAEKNNLNLKNSRRKTEWPNHFCTRKPIKNPLSSWFFVGMAKPLELEGRRLPCFGSAVSDDRQWHGVAGVWCFGLSLRMSVL